MPTLRQRLAPGIAALVACLPAVASAGPIVMNSPTTSWTAVLYPSTSPDFSNDQASPGQAESDIVGNATQAAFYTAFDNAGTPSLTDGMLAFRVRVGAEKSPAGFNKVAAVGIDANNDGVIDLFAMVDNATSGKIALYNPGAGANNSPATTTISATGITYTETSSNYNYTPVTFVIDPSATTLDVNGDGNTDQFLSFGVQFQDIVNRLALEGITVDQNTPFHYVLGTSTVSTSLNQDIAGPNGGTTSAVTWVGLGAFSDASAPAGAGPVPEPGTASLLGLGLCVLARRRRREQRR
jgi:hypothetical protein